MRQGRGEEEEEEDGRGGVKDGGQGPSPHRNNHKKISAFILSCRDEDNPHNNGPLTAQITARDEKGRFVGDHDLSGDLRPA
jgi:hypothetical protein